MVKSDCRLIIPYMKNTTQITNNDHRNSLSTELAMSEMKQNSKSPPLSGLFADDYKSLTIKPTNSKSNVPPKSSSRDTKLLHYLGLTADLALIDVK
ncbi:hypothetical protein EWB00_010718 [Schistosoma japonicum]|uniref:Uncharacterized protein n=1 Tax=Schistosoma japonicum TaxID=6182 RepID=A0A4Z2DNU4_SCHJA|nr:hypothetical protein EWB00_010718 [Schistosoma japonicum]